MRYCPIGWSKTYEFNEADFRCAIDLIDEYVNLQGERHNLPMDKIPWDAIQSVLINNIYGGKIDNHYDHMILKSLVEQYFCPDSFNYNKFMVNDVEDPELKVPEATKTSDFFKWIKALPDKETPLWSGLPLNAERVLLQKKSSYIISNLWKIQDINEEEITDIRPEYKKTQTTTSKGGTEVVKWLNELSQRVTIFMDILPTSLNKLNRNPNLMMNPLFRFLEREVTVMSNLVDMARKKLGELK